MPTIFSPELIRHQEQVRAARKELLRELFAEFNSLIVNTGKEDKLLALVELISNLTGRQLDQSEMLACGDPNQEIMALRASSVAKNKAERLSRGYLRDGENPYLLAGCDVNAFVEVDGVLRPNHKISRVFPKELPEEEFFKLRNKLRQQYCFPENGQVRVVWDLAAHLINGSAHTFNDLVAVLSRPVDPELLDQFLDEALKNGLILNSNLHMAAFELLVLNDQLISVSHLTGELEEKGFSLSDFVSLELSSELSSAILHSIVANVPIHVN